MSNPLKRKLGNLLGLTFLILAGTSTTVTADSILRAANHKDRPAEQRIRDEFRHPQQTLRFFGIQPNMSVVEISPGGGWYTNILAPLLDENGQLYAAHFYVDENTNDYFKRSLEGFKKKVAEHGPYKNIKITAFHPEKALDVAPEGSADMVLTFRNVHNWYMRHGDSGIENAFSAFFKALKKGGVLGVVEHRLPEDADNDMQQSSGYMKQSYVVKMAEKAGFKLEASSEVNANPLDNANHPKGVWTLPPRLRLGEKDKEKYQAIGESDRMTLKFVKP